MPPRVNPLKLNPLQLRTLAIFQELARHPQTSTKLDNGEVFLSSLPEPHGDHLHIGRWVVHGRDASGLTNPSVWVALERKGLVRATFPMAVTLTVEGLTYDTGIGGAIMHGSDH